MPPQIRSLLIMNAFSFIIFIYIGIFVNLYIWEHAHRIGDVAWFNLVLFLVWGFTFYIGAKMLRRFSIRVLFACSGLSGGIAFLLLSFLHIDNRMLWIAMIGVPVGMMWGFFSSAQGLSISLAGKGKDFANYFAAQGILTQILNVTVPILSAQVIYWFGYPGSFGLMLLFVIVMLVFSYFLPQISLKGMIDRNEKISVRTKLSWRFYVPTTSLRWLAVSALVAGVFLQFQGLFALIFTFSVTENKFYIALLNTCYTLATLLALYLYRKIRARERTWLLVCMVTLLVGFLIVLYPTAPLLVISNVLTTIGLFYFGTVWNAQHFRVISEFSIAERARILVWREGLLTVSRCLVLVLILPLADFRGLPFYMLLGFTLLTLLVLPFVQSRMVQGNLAPEEAAQEDGLPLQENTSKNAVTTSI